MEWFELPKVCRFVQTDGSLCGKTFIGTRTEKYCKQCGPGARAAKRRKYQLAQDARRKAARALRRAEGAVTHGNGKGTR